MNIFKYIVLCVLAQAVICPCARAISPAIKLPEWQKCLIYASDWQPESSVLSVSVVVKAVCADLYNVSAQIRPIDGFNAVKAPLPKQSAAAIKKGESRTFVFTFKANPNTSGSLMADVRAVPDKRALFNIVNAQNKPALTKKLILGEIEGIEKPIQIGRAFMLCLRSDIASAIPDELLFKPQLKHEKNEYYLWYPPAGLSSGITREALKVFNSGLLGMNVKKTDSAANMLKTKLNKDKLSLELIKSEDETISIPYTTVSELLSADTAVVKAVSAASTKPLSEFLQSSSETTKPFVLYNMAVLQAALNQKALARQSLEEALKIISAWPRAQKLLKRLN